MIKFVGFARRRLRLHKGRKPHGVRRNEINMYQTWHSQWHASVHFHLNNSRLKCLLTLWICLTFGHESAECRGFFLLLPWQKIDRFLFLRLADVYVLQVRCNRRAKLLRPGAWPPPSCAEVLLAACAQLWLDALRYWTDCASCGSHDASFVHHHCDCPMIDSLSAFLNFPCLSSLHLLLSSQM